MSSIFPRRVVCTGLGTVTSLGIGTKISWSALLASKSGITCLRDEHCYEGSLSRVASYVDEKQLDDNIKHEKHTYLVKHSRQLSRATKFAMIAAQEALEDAILLDENTNEVIYKFQERSGVSIGQGMVDFQDIHDNASYLDENPNKRGSAKKISPFFMTKALINMSSGNVSIRYKLKGPNNCVSTACATGAHSIGDAFNYIRHGKADIMVCGSTEACINKLSMAGFDRLKALSNKFNDSPQEASRPFDKNRGGFVMGEGAGILVLESLDNVLARGFNPDKIYAEVSGFGTTSDAYHLTAPLSDGNGAQRCMLEALNDAKVSPTQITHINAHATSTPLGDDIECNAVEKTFGCDTKRSNKISITSCKGSIGHLLGASGSVETIFAILSVKNSLLPHCLNLDDPLETLNNQLDFIQRIPKNWTDSEKVMLKNSFGFGGTNASLVIKQFIKS